MMRRWWLLALLLLLPAPVRAADMPPAQWIVVTAPAFRDSVEPLCQQRKAQGMQVTVLQTSALLTEKEILACEGAPLRERVNQLCRDAKGASYILLVGAVE